MKAISKDEMEGASQGIKALEAKIEALEAKVGILEDIEEIKKLQRIYGYYLDKKLWSEIIDLFSDDCSIELAQRGVYLGKKGAEIVFRQWLGRGRREDGLQKGEMHNHMQIQGVIHVAQGGKTAKGRWRVFAQIAGPSTVDGVVRQSWGEGPYEMEYVKEDGKWKIKKLHWYRTFSTPYEDGWLKTSLPMPGISTDFPPDLPPTEKYEPFPAVYIPPFHYKHPITGK